MVYLFFLIYIYESVVVVVVVVVVEVLGVENEGLVVPETES